MVLDDGGQDERVIGFVPCLWAFWRVRLGVSNLFHIAGHIALMSVDGWM